MEYQIYNTMDGELDTMKLIKPNNLITDYFSQPLVSTDVEYASFQFSLINPIESTKTISARTLLVMLLCSVFGMILAMLSLAIRCSEGPFSNLCNLKIRWLTVAGTLTTFLVLQGFAYSIAGVRLWHQGKMVDEKNLSTVIPVRLFNCLSCSALLVVVFLIGWNFYGTTLLSKSFTSEVLENSCPKNVNILIACYTIPTVIFPFCECCSQCFGYSLGGAMFLEKLGDLPRPNAYEAC